jgi:hypothetical protein
MHLSSWTSRPFASAITRLFVTWKATATITFPEDATTVNVPNSSGNPSKVTELHRFKAGPFKDVDFEVVSVDAVKRRKVLAFGKCMRIDISDDELAKWMKEG